MTPQLFVKLSRQVARQTPEAQALEAQAMALQPAIDSAQAWVDSCQAATDAAQAALTEAQAADGANTAAQQDALNAANATLATAKDDLAKAKAPQDVATAHARQIRAQIAACQAQLDASGMTMTPAEMDAVENAPLVPSEVTMRQARLALLGAGKLTLVDAAIDALPEPQRSAARIEWEYSSAVQRHNGFVEALGPALGMTPEQIDALFVAAAAL